MTARPPFMSEAPRPHSVSPSTLGSLFWLAGTVSRCPARISRLDRPRAVRATTLSASRSTSNQSHRRSCSSTRSAMARSEWLSEGMATRSAVAARRSVTVGDASGAGAVGAQDLVQLCLVVTLALGQPLNHEDARHEELAPGVLAAPAGRHRHRPGGHHPAAYFRA